MPQSAVETSQQLVYAGPFSLPLLIGAGLVLAAVIVALLWREGGMANRRAAPFLIALRLGALGVLLWMLASPTMVLTTRYTRPRSISILVDASASMGTADPPDAVTAARWSGRDAYAPAERSVAALDLASANLALAGADLVRASRSVDFEQETQRLERQIEAASTAVKEAGQVLGLLRSDESAEQLRQALAQSIPALLEYVRQSAAASPNDPEARSDVLGAGNELLAAASKLSAAANRVAAEVELPANQPPISRSERVASFLQWAEGSWLGPIAEQAVVARYGFNAAAFPVARFSGPLIDPTGQGLTTDLAAALEQARRDAGDSPVEAIMLLSDGGHNAESDALKAAAAGGPPVYVVPIGDPQPQRDVILHHALAPRAVYLNDTTVIEATVDVYGCAGERVTAELLTDGQMLASESFAAPSDNYVRRLTFQAKAGAIGTHTYTVRVTELPDERLRDNNAADVRVEVAEETMRVLVVDRLPRWEYRYLRNLFRRDERVEFTPVLLSGSATQSSSIPQDIEEWSRYRVVILGDLTPDVLDERQQRLLEEYVARRGGTLLILAGDAAMPQAYSGAPLEKLIPVEKTEYATHVGSGFAVKLTEEGRANAALQLTDTWSGTDELMAQLSARLPIHQINAWCKPKPHSRVLMSAAPIGTEGGEDRRAYLCWQFYGSGRVVYLASPTTYRLRYLAGDLYHHRFWGQLLRWAISRELDAGTKTVRLATDKTVYTQADTVQVTVTLKSLDGNPVVGAAGRIEAFQDRQPVAGVDWAEDARRPGTYRATLQDLPTGQVTLRVGGQRVRELLSSEGYGQDVEQKITVDPEAPAELRNTQANLQLLSSVAEATGGAVLAPEALKLALERLDLSPHVTETVERRPLWTRWELLWAFVGCLSAEWVLRKLVGLA